MSSRIRIKIGNWRKTFASLRYIQLCEWHTNSKDTNNLPPQGQSVEYY